MGFCWIKSLVENAYKKKEKKNEKKKFRGKGNHVQDIMRAWFSFWQHSFMFGLLK